MTEEVLYLGVQDLELVHDGLRVSPRIQSTSYLLASLNIHLCVAFRHCTPTRIHIHTHIRIHIHTHIRIHIHTHTNTQTHTHTEREGLVRLECSTKKYLRKYKEVKNKNKNKRKDIRKYKGVQRVTRK
jgi:hypothetical protein